MITHATAKGNRHHQEDSHFIAEFVNGTLIGVMDGHGGAAVSALLVGLFPELWSDVCKTETNIERIFLEVFARAHEVTKWYHEGSTASLVFIPTDQTVAHVAVLGDSPVIVETDSSADSTTVWTSPDHNARSNMEERSLAIQRGGIYFQGYIWNDMGDMGTGLQMTRALGDSAMGGSILDHTPEVFTVRLGNFLLVGSDGLSDPTHKERVVTTPLVNEIDNGRTVEELVQRALAVPTGDNVTAVLWRRDE